MSSNRAVRAVTALTAFFMLSSVEAQPLTHINVGVLKIAGLADAYAAKMAHMFEHNGLDASLVVFNSGAQAAAAQQSGAIDFALTLPGTAMVADEHGFSFLAVFQNELVKDQPPDSGSVQSLVSSQIKSLRDLAGKRVATAQMDSQATIAAQYAMRKAGMDPATVKLVEIPFQNQADALKNHLVDAIITTEPYTTQLVTSGQGRVLSWNYVEAMPGAPLGVWWAKKAYIDTHGDVVARFDRAIKESIDYMNADTARARRITTEFTGLDIKLVNKMPPLRFNYVVKPDNWQHVIDLMSQAKVLEKPPQARAYFSEQLKPYIRP